MANVKITELTALTDPASTDVLPIVDVVADVTKKISIADLLENAGSGTAAAPGIAFDGDSNTGIYRPGADQLAISTGGTQRINIEADGDINIDSGGVFYDATNNRLAIGTTNPARNLHINGADSDTVQVHLTNSTTGGGANDGFSLVLGSDESAILNMRESNPMRFLTSDTERMRIDSSGRLLVGTSSYSLAATAVLQGNSSASSEDAVFRMNRGGTPGANADLGLITFGDNAGNIGAAIRATNDTASSWGTGDYPGRLTFSTTADGASSLTERMRIASNGVFNHFTSDDFNVRTANTSAGAGCLLLKNGASSTSNGTTVFVVFGDGDVANTNNTYGAISDFELKENVVDANSQWLDIKALKVRNYNFKIETGYSTHTQIGVIAQEVELVSPGLVGESIDKETGKSTKKVNYSVLYMKAVKALQEAMERIETLEDEMAAVKAQLA